MDSTHARQERQKMPDLSSLCFFNKKQRPLSLDPCLRYITIINLKYPLYYTMVFRENTGAEGFYMQLSNILQSLIFSSEIGAHR